MASSPPVSHGTPASRPTCLVHRHATPALSVSVLVRRPPVRQWADSLSSARFEAEYRGPPRLEDRLARATPTRLPMHGFVSMMASSLLLAAAVAPATAQIAAPNDAGVAMGHLHYVVRDVEANAAFWVALGGEADRVGDTVVVAFPDVLVMLDEGESSGGTEGSILNHMAFRVQSLATVAVGRLRVRGPRIGHHQHLHAGGRADRAVRRHGDEPDVHAWRRCDGYGRPAAQPAAGRSHPRAPPAPLSGG